MSDFDPKAFLAQGEPESFDPKAFLAQGVKKPDKFTPDIDTQYSSEGIPLVTPATQAEPTGLGKTLANIGTDVVSAPIRAAASIAKPLAGIAEYTGYGEPSKALLSMDKGIKEQTGPISTLSSFAGDIAGLGAAAKIATPVLKGATSLAPQLANVPAWLKPILYSGAAGAIEPTGKAAGEKGFNEQKLGQIGLAAALGPVAQKIGQSVAGVMSPQLQRLKDLASQGINVDEFMKKSTLGQTLGGGAQSIENALQVVPFGNVKKLVQTGQENLENLASKRASSFEDLLSKSKTQGAEAIKTELDTVKKQLETQHLISTDKLNSYIDTMKNQLTTKHEDFSVPILNKVLANIDQKLKPGLTGNDAVNYVATQVGKSFDDALEKIGTVPIAPHHLQELNSVLTKAEKDFGLADPAKFAQLKSDINTKMLGNFMDADSIPAKQWHDVYKEIGETAFNTRTGSSFDQKYGQALRDAQKVWTKMAMEVDKTGAIKKANTAYSELQIPQRAAADLTTVKTTEGAFTPEKLLGAAKVEAGIPKFGRGVAPYQQEAQAALKMMNAERDDLAKQISALQGKSGAAQKKRLEELTAKKDELTQQLANKQEKINKFIVKKNEETKNLVQDFKEKIQPGAYSKIVTGAGLAGPLIPAMYRGLTQQEGAIIPNVVSNLANLGPGYYAALALPTALTRLGYGNTAAQTALKNLATKRPEIMKQAGEDLRNQIGLSMLGGTEAIQSIPAGIQEKLKGIGQKEGGLVQLTKSSRRASK